MNDTIENTISIVPESLGNSRPTDPYIDTDESEVELPNIALAPEQVATLQSLIERYDQVVQNLDLLNTQIETLLAQETIKACDS